jgi:hypothetical protein
VRGQPEWHCHHTGEAGSFDETARRASHEELGVAKVLASEGHNVRTVLERKDARTPDLVACGTSVEVKAFQSLQQRDGRPPRPEHVANKMLDARGQGAVAVIWAGTSGLTQATAQAGYGLFCERARETGLGRIRAVRVIGEGFDMSFKPSVDLSMARRAVATVRRPPLTTSGPSAKRLEM